MVRTAMLTLPLALLNCGFAQAQGKMASAASVQPTVVLVELFTSEGCSSCPPADALLRRIDGTRAGKDRLIVGLSEHVTYWNSLGWTDRFSSPIFTDRQNAYGAALALDSVYTPQMVVNGTEQFVGSDERSLDAAIRREESRDTPVAVRILSATVSGQTLVVEFSATASGRFDGGDMVAVIADDSDQTSVLRGENSGRTLNHVAVARSLTRVGRFETGARQTARVALPEGFNAAEKHHLVLFAQAGGAGRVLGTDSKPI